MSKIAKTECRQIRDRMRYSIAEMAEAVGLKKDTHRGYDDGSRSVPEEVVEAIKAEEARCREQEQGRQEKHRQQPRAKRAQGSG